LLITYGCEARAISESAAKKGVQVYHVKDRTEAAKVLKKIVKPFDVVLFKGSHSMAVDKVIDLVFKKEEGK
jgi:UDP-N-acetylmuramyl pentapeptide synthase